MLKRFERFIPRYSWIYIVITLTLHFAAYFGTRLLPRNFLYLTSPLDEKIPFLPAFSIIYLLAYVQWIAGLILICRESPQACRTILGGEIIGKFFCLLFFIFLPTSLVRPEVTGSGFSAELLRLIYRLDQPDNLFPSMHCLESWTCFRSGAFLKKTPAWYQPVSLIFTLLVFASTVCLRQHVLVDIPAGMAVFEIGFLMTRLFEARRQKTGPRTDNP